MKKIRRKDFNALFCFNECVYLSHLSTKDTCQVPNACLAYVIGQVFLTKTKTPIEIDPTLFMPNFGQIVNHEVIQDYFNGCKVLFQ